jgi:hypothetical protein
MPESAARARTRRRRRILSWVPISVVALLCVAVVIGAFVMQSSWWTDLNRAPSDDQEGPGGSSMFGDGGVDYLTREGRLRVIVRPDSPSAGELDLPERGERTVETRVPVQGLVSVAEGAISFDTISAFTVHTASDRVQSVDLVLDGVGDWLAAVGDVESRSSMFGWSSDDLERADEGLLAARRAGESRYRAAFPAREYDGAWVSAVIDVDVASSAASLTYTVALDAP